jgi:hypothetical protein
VRFLAFAVRSGRTAKPLFPVVNSACALLISHALEVWLAYSIRFGKSTRLG